MIRSTPHLLASHLAEMPCPPAPAPMIGLPASILARNWSKNFLASEFHLLQSFSEVLLEARTGIIPKFRVFVSSIFFRMPRGNSIVKLSEIAGLGRFAERQCRILHKTRIFKRFRYLKIDLRSGTVFPGN